MSRSFIYLLGLFLGSFLYAVCFVLFKCVSFYFCHVILYCIILYYIFISSWYVSFLMGDRKGVDLDRKGS